MTVSALVRLVVIYEDEIRKAAKLLHQYYELQAETPDEEAHRALADTIRACRVALYHPGLLDDTAIVMLTAGQPFTRKRKK